MSQSLSFQIRPDDAVDPTQLHRVLIIKLRHHGDVLLTSPVLSVLQAAAPQAQIDVLVYADTAAMISQHPALAQLHCIDRQWKRLGPWRQALAELALLRRLRQRRYDLVVHLTEHRRGAWLTRLLQPRWAVAANGDYGRFFAKSFSHRFEVVNGNRRHTVQLHLDALRRIGVYPSVTPKLALAIDDESRAVVAGLLQNHQLRHKDFIVLHPGSRWLFKCWPVPSMRELLGQLAHAGYRVVLTGAPDADEAAMVTAIVDGASAMVVNLQGKLTLKQLAALIAQARLFIGVDSAPMHIAAAVQTPVIAFFGPSGEREWGPWQVPHRLLVSDQHACRPCGRDGCGGGKRSDCLQVLGVDQAWRAVQDLLTETA